jgi:hypothetical protein
MTALLRPSRDSERLPSHQGQLEAEAGGSAVQYQMIVATGCAAVAW